MRHCARGVAYAAKGDGAAARHEQSAFHAARAPVPAEAFFGNNTAADLLAVAEDLLEGEILYREGRTEAAIVALRQAVAHEDALRYDEPPGWIQPTRHALGAILLKTGRDKEAEMVFREDLDRLPDNGWGLWGLATSLERQGKGDEAARTRARFAEIWAHSDVELATPCYCEPRV
jgi:tetratricopeptide (TPR) repeat protein